MSLYELVERCNILLKKYGQYLIEDSNPNKHSNDPFELQLGNLEDRIKQLEREAVAVQSETSKSELASRNAAIRRKKQQIMTVDAQELQKMCKVDPKKGNSADTIKFQIQRINDLMNRCENIPDGTIAGRKTPRDKPKEFIELTGLNTELIKNADYYSHTQETAQFEQEWQISKQKQDKQLDRIERGMVDLKGMAEQIGEEIERQNVFVDEIDNQVDKVQSQLVSYRCNE
eukprot:TRINITY_DN9974_c3_g1_i1.p1 TRINITY_DN9974_c3_g1~~TRINITY_DN9974_c3_g1_i1.p1  ORF type:complete len:230 (-),score=35.35 TRINITY_DN9974_c3_g1_i1:35-724(-)